MSEFLSFGGIYVCLYDPWDYFGSRRLKQLFFESFCSSSKKFLESFCQLIFVGNLFRVEDPVKIFSGILLINFGINPLRVLR